MRLQWVRREGNLADIYPARATRLPAAPMESRIESRCDDLEAVGERPAWTEGYGTVARKPSEVRSARVLGRFYADLVRRLRPSTVVEFGTAFGVSGMYFTAALQETGQGRLLTFEPNHSWAEVATESLAHVGGRYEATVGTFEDNLHRIDAPIDLALIDAVHTSEWVVPQFDLVAERARSGSVILLDDIDFSDDMRACWDRLSRDPRVAGSVAVADHLGVVELAY